MRRMVLCEVLEHISNHMESAYDYDIVSVSCIADEAYVAIAEHSPTKRGDSLYTLLVRFECGFACIYNSDGLRIYRKEAGL